MTTSASSNSAQIQLTEESNMFSGMVMKTEDANKKKEPTGDNNKDKEQERKDQQMGKRQGKAARRRVKNKETK